MSEERTVEEYVKGLNLKEITKLEELFELWKKAHVIEVEEIRRKIKEEKREWECDGKTFQEKIYNGGTVSSHFIQFFYRDKCRECVEMKEKEVWQYVLEKAFNADGCVGGYAIPTGGYKYIVLLKEANDSNKNCVYKNYKEEALPNQWLLDWKEWILKREEEKKSNYKMLNKLNKAFEILLEKQPEQQQFFFEEMAYMNVNKRGGASTTESNDQEAVIQYAKKYRDFILKEIDLLSPSSKDEEVTVFICGRRDNYFEMLLKELCGESIKIQGDMSRYTDISNGRKIKFVNLTHPSGRISAGNLAKEMSVGKSK